MTGGVDADGRRQRGGAGGRPSTANASPCPAACVAGRTETPRRRDLATGGGDPRGKRIGPADLGLAASSGWRRWPSPGACGWRSSTGDRARQHRRPLAPGEVRDSNHPTLHGALARLGCELIDMGVVPDRPDELEAAFTTAAGSADVVLTTGGGVGGQKPISSAIPMQRLRSGFLEDRHQAGGRRWPSGASADLNAWPAGNPVAVMVTFYQFVQDAPFKAIRRRSAARAAAMPAVCVAPVRKLAGRCEFLRGRLFAEDGVWKVKPARVGPGLGVRSLSSEANCFIVIDERPARRRDGQRGPLPVQLFRGPI